MTFKQLNKRFLEPSAQTLMILGIVALCQPWSDFFHRYGLLMIIIGFAAFMVTSKIPAEPEVHEEEEDMI
jgi:hypothetical protein